MGLIGFYRISFGDEGVKELSDDTVYVAENVRQAIKRYHEQLPVAGRKSSPAGRMVKPGAKATSLDNPVLESIIEQYALGKNWEEEQEINGKRIKTIYGSSYIVVGQFMFVDEEFWSRYQSLLYDFRRHIIVTTFNHGVLTGSIDFRHTLYTRMAIVLMQAFAEDIIGKTVLDAGSGDGILSMVASRLGAARVFGVEHQQGWVDISEKLLRINGISNVHLLPMDLQDIPNTPQLQRVDVVLANLKESGFYRPLGDLSPIRNWHVDLLTWIQPYMYFLFGANDRGADYKWLTESSSRLGWNILHESRVELMRHAPAVAAVLQAKPLSDDASQSRLVRLSKEIVQIKSKPASPRNDIRAYRQLIRLLRIAGILPSPGQGHIIAPLNGPDLLLFEQVEGTVISREASTLDYLTGLQRQFKGLDLSLDTDAIQHNLHNGSRLDFNDAEGVRSLVARLQAKHQSLTVFLKHVESYFMVYEMTRLETQDRQSTAYLRSLARKNYERALTQFVQDVVPEETTFVVFDNSTQHYTDRILASLGFPDVTAEILPPQALRNLEKMSSGGLITVNGQNLELSGRLRVFRKAHSGGRKSSPAGRRLSGFKQQLRQVVFEPRVHTSHATRQGLRKHQEDRWVNVALSLDDVPHGRGQLMAVLDGHNGAEVSALVSWQLPEYFEAALRFTNGTVAAALQQMFEQLAQLTDDCEVAGTTLSVVYIPQDESRVYWAFVGDSPIIVKDKDGKFLMPAVHNVDNPQERKYVERRADKIESKGYGVYHAKTGKMMFLEVTRTLGDSVMVPAVRRTPDIGAYELGKDSFVLLATDGLLRGLHSPNSNHLISLIEQNAGADLLLETVDEPWDNLTAIVFRYEDRWGNSKLSDIGDLLRCFYCLMPGYGKKSSVHSARPVSGRKSSPAGRREARRPDEEKIMSMRRGFKQIFGKAGIRDRISMLDTDTGVYAPTRDFFASDIIENLPIRAGADVIYLEPGHGQGQHALKAAHWHRKLKVIGIESDESLFEESRSLLAAAEKIGFVLPGQVQLLNGDFNDRQFTDYFRKADIVYYYSAGTRDLKSFAATLLRDLRPEARIVEYGGGRGELQEHIAVIGRMSEMTEVTFHDSVFMRVFSLKAEDKGIRVGVKSSPAGRSEGFNAVTRRIKVRHPSDKIYHYKSAASFVKCMRQINQSFKPERFVILLTNDRGDQASGFSILNVLLLGIRHDCLLTVQAESTMDKGILEKALDLVHLVLTNQDIVGWYLPGQRNWIRDTALFDRALQRLVQNITQSRGRAVGSKSSPAGRRHNRPGAEEVVINRLLARHFVDYFVAGQEIVNPDGRDITVGYGGGGADIASVVLATDPTHIKMIDSWPVSLAKLRQHHEEWKPINNQHKHFTKKFQDGHAFEVGFLHDEDVEFFMMQELRAMGVRKEDIRLGVDEKGRPKLTFWLPGETHRARHVVFIQGDFTRPSRELDQELQGQLDVYYQKAVPVLKYDYPLYLPFVKGWIKPKGFVVLNPYTHDKNEYVDVSAYMSGEFVQRRSDEQERLADTIVPLVPSHERYGWYMSLWQEQSSGNAVTNFAAKSDLKFMGSGAMLRFFAGVGAIIAALFVILQFGIPRTPLLDVIAALGITGTSDIVGTVLSQVHLNGFLSWIVFLTVGEYIGQLINLRRDGSRTFKPLWPLKLIMVPLTLVLFFAWFWPMTYILWLQSGLPLPALGLVDQLTTGPISMFIFMLLHGLIESRRIDYRENGRLSLLIAVIKAKVPALLTSLRWNSPVWVLWLGGIFFFVGDELARIVWIGMLSPISAIFNSSLLNNKERSRIVLKWWAKIILPVSIIYSFFILPQVINLPALFLGVVFYAVVLYGGIERKAGSKFSPAGRSPDGGEGFSEKAPNALMAGLRFIREFKLNAWVLRGMLIMMAWGLAIVLGKVILLEEPLYLNGYLKFIFEKISSWHVPPVVYLLVFFTWSNIWMMLVKFAQSRGWWSKEKSPVSWSWKDWSFTTQEQSDLQALIQKDVKFKWLLRVDALITRFIGTMIFITVLRTSLEPLAIGITQIFGFGLSLISGIYWFGYRKNIEAERRFERQTWVGASIIMAGFILMLVSHSLSSGAFISREILWAIVFAVLGSFQILIQKEMAGMYRNLNVKITKYGYRFGFLNALTLNLILIAAGVMGLQAFLPAYFAGFVEQAMTIRWEYFLNPAVALMSLAFVVVWFNFYKLLSSPLSLLQINFLRATTPFFALFWSKLFLGTAGAWLLIFAGVLTMIGALVVSWKRNGEAKNGSKFSPKRPGRKSSPAGESAQSLVDQLVTNDKKKKDKPQRKLPRWVWLALTLLILFIPPERKNGFVKEKYSINDFVLSKDLPDQTKIKFPEGRLFSVEWNRFRWTIVWPPAAQPVYQEFVKYRNIDKPIVPMMTKKDFEFRAPPIQYLYRGDRYYCYSCRVRQVRASNARFELAAAVTLPLPAFSRVEEETVFVSQHFIRPGISRRHEIRKDPPSPKDLLEVIKLLGNELFWYRYFAKTYLGERVYRGRELRPQELFVEERFFDLDQRGPAMRASEGVVGFDQLVALENGLFWI